MKCKGDHVCFILVRDDTCASGEWDNKAARDHPVTEQSFPKPKLALTFFLSGKVIKNCI